MGLAFSTQTSDAVALTGPLDNDDGPRTDLLHSAVALQPPNQSDTPRKPDSGLDSPNQRAKADCLTQGQTREGAVPVAVEVVL